MMSRQQNHTGKELELMRARVKPLAIFCDDADIDPADSVIPEREFDHFVGENLFEKAERVFELPVDPRTGRPRRLRYVLYSLVDENWRIRAMLVALETMMKMGRADEGIDRMMGALLGYDSH